MVFPDAMIPLIPGGPERRALTAETGAAPTAGAGMVEDVWRRYGVVVLPMWRGMSTLLIHGDSGALWAESISNLVPEVTRDVLAFCLKAIDPPRDVS